MSNRIAVAGALVVVGLLAGLPQAGWAAGGTSIAAAPQLPFGVLEAGGGTPDEFWRVSTYGGDRLTMRIDWGVDTLGMIEVYPPSVDDYTLLEASPVWVWRNDGNEGGGKRQYSFTVPFTGNGTLAICERNGGTCDENPPEGVNLGDLSDAFSFTLVDAHAASLRLSAPTLARRRSTVRVTGRVQSPAGVPQGSCLFPHGRIAPVNTSGVCSGRVRLGRGAHQSIRVRFEPDEGWQPDTASRTIHLLR